MKTSPDDLIDEIAEDFTHYLRLGNVAPFFREIDSTLAVVNMDRLLRIHFVLTKSREPGDVGVVDFVEKLPLRLRNLKTTLLPMSQALQYEVRGRIKWQETLRERDRRGGTNGLFLCDELHRDYSTAENIVLKSVLSIVFETLADDLPIPEENNPPQWLEEWGTDSALTAILEAAFLRNIYIRRVQLPKSRIPDRLVERVSQSRIPLYREAALLLRRYRQLVNFDLDAGEARELLRNTFVRPDREDLLFELYWVIRISRQFTAGKQHIIEKGSNVVAEWQDGDSLVRVYHNSTADYVFRESSDGLSSVLKEHDNYFGRILKVLSKQRAITGIDSMPLWAGRPDILVERTALDGTMCSLLLGEVKYTVDKDYAREGLRELLQYVALVKRGGDYLETNDSLFDSMRMVRGCLFLDRVEAFPQTEEDDPIQIRTVDDRRPLALSA